MSIDYSHSALVIIDVQNDFCPGGALAVEKGDEVIGPLNALAWIFASRSGKVIATQDWHPKAHVSFASSHTGKKPGDSIDLGDVKDQILWPDHCVQGSFGAELRKDLAIEPVNLIIRKGFHAGIDSYSAFFENDRNTQTGLDGYLRALSVDTLVFGGLATDYCVLYSALDAGKLGYETYIVADAIRGVGKPEGSIRRALELLKTAGAIITGSGDFK